MPPVRIRIDLAYDGTDFHGWADQPGLRTVQGVLEAALATALRRPQLRVTCAGRTDTGVHARGQVVHADVDADAFAASSGRPDTPPGEALRRRLNGILPADVRVHRVAESPAGFDARFSALWREYVYRIADRPATQDPLLRGHVLSWGRELDEQAMHRAAQRLVGEHDFASFCRRREGATTIRTLLGYDWTRRADGLLEATVRADAFCHSMVRALVGCLVAVGEGRRDDAWVQQVLTDARRNPAVTVIHAHGLTLERVCYPPDAELASRAETARSVRRLDR
ncbi:tRNA pseudouridine(38-40) synthase TruA [Nocardioides limicola]|uniref:tRNA pseudouridine(38-40) synthase TruA n=1 Tax=Nocardioides limicola TaxID=2803368 RepID=UPI00193B6FA0|nr:tRNA pseudouridine(38-40) synthase TruA [Nocardioides sp. DJM-14]